MYLGVFKVADHESDISFLLSLLIILLLFRVLDMNIYQITDLIHTKESSIQFLQERNILRSVPPICPSCNQRMSESRRVSRGDGTVWRCQRRHPGSPQCNKKQAIRHGSFLVNSNLEPRQFIMLTYFWAQGISSSS